MKSRRQKPIDLLAVGELLVDGIATDNGRPLGKVRNFRLYQGGSAANLAANMARLGNAASLIACVGEDGLGKALVAELQATGLNTEGVHFTFLMPTTLILIGRSDATPEFIPYRMADCLIECNHIQDTDLDRTTIFHTTCFALSAGPARSSILHAAWRARERGCTLSLDMNYAPQIWPDRQEAQRIIAGYCESGCLIKLSRDDMIRLFQVTDDAADSVINRLHEWGANLVCLTLGPEGSLLSWNHGALREHIPAQQVRVADVTGAGDAYWAGFLTAWLDGHEPPDCARAATRMAALKLQHVGPLPHKIQKSILYEDGL